ncbi:MAG: alpha/beta hydrolase [Lysobacterales bacterium]|jgi:acetyl esterase/lipase
MPSLRSRAFGLFMNLAVRPLWSEELDIVKVRDRMKRLDAILGSGNSVGHTTPVLANGVPCEWIDATEKPEKHFLLYFHGGGFSVHLPRFYNRLAAELSALFDCEVILPDYRLAPEFPFPAAPDDCLAVYQWLLEERRIAPGHLLLAGDSAGGNLVLGTLLSAKAVGLPMPAAAWVISTSVDCDWSESDYQRMSRTPDPMFNAHALELLGPYFGDADRRDYRISPIYGDLSGLPPILIEAGGSELFTDQPGRFKALAACDAIEVEAVVTPGMPHVYPLFKFLPEARKSRRRALAFFSRHLARHER